MRNWIVIAAILLSGCARPQVPPPPPLPDFKLNFEALRSAKFREACTEWIEAGQCIELRYTPDKAAKIDSVCLVYIEPTGVAHDDTMTWHESYYSIVIPGEWVKSGENNLGLVIDGKLVDNKVRRLKIK